MSIFTLERLQIQVLENLEYLFTKTELAEELGDELVWCSIPCDFSKDFPSAGQIDLKKVNWHAHGQAFVDSLKAFNGFLNERDVAGVREVGSILLDKTSIFKEEGINPVFDVVDILIFKDRNFDVICRDFI